ncbi:hypothetical protein R1sor_003909 [Riccia sorocarpa]|uniref:Secreted protein n=1 Tax=Riccia sorocarpa TaxID=122646 RepID=A0ABD3H5U1_9MARC
MLFSVGLLLCFVLGLLQQAEKSVLRLLALALFGGSVGSVLCRFNRIVPPSGDEAICGRLAVGALLLASKAVSVRRDCLIPLHTCAYGVRFRSETIPVVEDLKLLVRLVFLRLLDARSRRETCLEDGRESCMKVACDGLHSLLTHSCFGAPRTPLSFVLIA